MRSASAQRSPLDELARPRLPEPLVVLDDQLAPGEYVRRRAASRPPFVRIVIDAHMVALGRPTNLSVGIENHQVGVTSRSDGPLLRVEAEDLRRSSAGDLHVTIDVDPLGTDSRVPQQAHPLLDARRSIGNFRKAVLPELLLLLHAERAMVCRHQGQIILFQPSPEGLLVALRPKRRAHHVLRSLEAWLLVVLVGKEEVLRTGLRHRLDATVAGLANLLQGL